jgi:hydroxyacid-oxoacid transhydrogenase
MTEYRTETVFTWGAPPLKFGVGALDEIGFDCAQLGLERVLIVTDEGVAATGVAQGQDRDQPSPVAARAGGGRSAHHADAAVTASCGMDILCHALESYTARHYRSYPRRRPEQRAVYVGNNPVSDAFIEKALPLLSRSFRRAVLTGNDLDARTDMLLAASFAGMGFGNAGVHVPHACGYPVAGRVGSYRPPDYPQAEAMVPHGESVALTAPAAFRFTFPTDPERHLRAAELLDPRADQSKDPRERLPRAIVSLMRDIGVPNGIADVGYSHSDIPDLVEGALKQQRILTMAPRDVMAEDLEAIFGNSMRNW